MSVADNAENITNGEANMVNRQRSESVPTAMSVPKISQVAQARNNYDPESSGYYAWNRNAFSAALPYANIPRTIGGGSYVIRNPSYTTSSSISETNDSGLQYNQSSNNISNSNSPCVSISVNRQTPSGLHLVVQKGFSSEDETFESSSINPRSKNECVCGNCLASPNIKVTPPSPNSQRFIQQNLPPMRPRNLSVERLSIEEPSRINQRSKSLAGSGRNSPVLGALKETSGCFTGSCGAWLQRSRPDLVLDFSPSQARKQTNSAPNSPSSACSTNPLFISSGQRYNFSTVHSTPNFGKEEHVNQSPVMPMRSFPLRPSFSCTFVEYPTASVTPQRKSSFANPLTTYYTTAGMQMGVRKSSVPNMSRKTEFSIARPPLSVYVSTPNESHNLVQPGQDSSALLNRDINQHRQTEQFNQPLHINIGCNESFSGVSETGVITPNSLNSAGSSGYGTSFEGNSTSGFSFGKGGFQVAFTPRLPSPLVLNSGATNQSASNMPFCHKPRKPNISFGPASSLEEFTGNNSGQLKQSVSHDVQQPMAPSDQYVKSLISHQCSRRDKMCVALESAKRRANELQSDVTHMEKHLLNRRKHSLTQSMLNPDTMTALHAETRKVQAEVQTIMRELELYREGQGVTGSFHEAVAFRGGIKGAKGSNIEASTGSNVNNTVQTQLTPSAYKYHPWRLSCDSKGPPDETLLKKVSHIIKKQHGNKSLKGSGSAVFYVDSTDDTVANGGAVSDIDEKPWSCGACTFMNDYAMPYCEVCQMPKIPKVKSTSLNHFSEQKCYCHACHLDNNF